MNATVLKSALAGIFLGYALSGSVQGGIAAQIFVIALFGASWITS